MKDKNQLKILSRLHALADPAKLDGMAHFGMATERRLGIPVPPIRALAKEIGTNQPLALELWQTGIAEARILATILADPHSITPIQMDAWAADLNSWDVCDHACGNLFDKTPYAWEKVRQWAAQEAQFTRRAGYALLACLAWHDKQAPDQNFIDAFPIIKAGAADPRNFVKKAVNWALRNIGKRNRALNAAAIKLARDIDRIDDKTAHWIAKDALRELTAEKTRARLKKKGEKSALKG